MHTFQGRNCPISSRFSRPRKWHCLLKSASTAPRVRKALKIDPQAWSGKANPNPKMHTSSSIRMHSKVYADDRTGSSQHFQAAQGKCLGPIERQKPEVQGTQTRKSHKNLARLAPCPDKLHHMPSKATALAGNTALQQPRSTVPTENILLSGSSPTRLARPFGRLLCLMRLGFC